jgi:hypothetical protein
MSRPALRVICSLHGRTFALLEYANGRLIFKAGDWVIPLDDWPGDVIPAQCPRCDAAHLPKVSDIRRAIDAGERVLKSAPERPPTPEELSDWYWNIDIDIDPSEGGDWLKALGLDDMVPPTARSRPSISPGDVLDSDVLDN